MWWRRRRAEPETIPQIWYPLWRAACAVLTDADIQAAWADHMITLGRDPEAELRELQRAIARAYPYIAGVAGLELTDGP